MQISERAQELSAVIATKGQAPRWNTMQFGPSNASPTFRELMNSIITVFNGRPKVQPLLKRRAVIEAYIDKILLSTKTKAHHMEVID